MSGHANRIGSGIGYGTTRAEHDAAFAALDALLAENQRLRDLQQMLGESWSKIRALASAGKWDECRDLAVEEWSKVAASLGREALAGDTE